MSDDAVARTEAFSFSDERAVSVFRSLPKSSEAVAGRGFGVVRLEASESIAVTGSARLFHGGSSEGPGSGGAAAASAAAALLSSARDDDDTSLGFVSPS